METTPHPDVAPQAWWGEVHVTEPTSLGLGGVAQAELLVEGVEMINTHKNEQTVGLPLLLCILSVTSCLRTLSSQHKSGGRGRGAIPSPNPSLSP